jgi:flagellar motor switch protein FliN/FliY
MALGASQLASWVVETLADRFAEAIETMAGERPAVVTRTVEAPPALEGALWWNQPLSLGPDMTILLGVPEAAWQAIGKYILSSAGVESTDEAEIRSTFLEIASQALSGVARAVGSRVGKTVACENGAEVARPEPGSPASEIEVALASGAVVLRLHISPGLLHALSPPELATGTAVVPSEPDVRAPRPTGNGSTLDLLMEVELPVSVSFGRAELPLKDVLKLTTGSIVELNRMLTAPVEVIVNNCVVARGEVVAIDGNYGVRIQEIISRDKRLRTLR